MRNKTILAGLLTAEIVSARSNPTINLSAGTVHGSWCPTSQAQLFQGIPYAQPPTGNLRFMPPQPLDKSYPDKVLEATKAPSPCIQWGTIFDVDDPTPSEDCLYIDVYVPANATSGSDLPVKVWAYGGSNLGGALTYPLYDACNLATDAIVVAFNYRLGPLGFLGLESAGIEGNMAIKDALAALEWVQSNIADFGGDKSKVVLFGQSAGADDAFTLSTLPQAKSLLSAVILESGGGQDSIPYDTAQSAGASYAKTLKCSDSDLACLQSRSVKELVDALSETPALSPQSHAGESVSLVYGINLPNVGTLSGAMLDGKLIKEQPLKVGSQVPIVAGSNEFDGTLLVLPTLLGSSQDLTAENYTSFLAQWGPAGTAIGKQYPLSLFNDSDSTSDAVTEAITHIVTTSSFTCSAYKALQAAVSAGTPAYAYRFNHTPSCPWLWVSGEPFPGSQLSDVFLSAHTAELPFVFANLDQQPWGNGTCNATAGEQHMSKTFTSAWTAMAAGGSPSTPLQEWPRFDGCKTRGLYVQDGFKQATLDFSECEFWDKVWADYGGVSIAGPSNSSCSSSSSSAGNATRSVAVATSTRTSAPSSSTSVTTGSGRKLVAGQLALAVTSILLFSLNF